MNSLLYSAHVLCVVHVSDGADVFVAICNQNHDDVEVLVLLVE